MILYPIGDYSHKALPKPSTENILKNIREILEKIFQIGLNI